MLMQMSLHEQFGTGFISVYIVYAHMSGEMKWNLYACYKTGHKPAFRLGGTTRLGQTF